jgi:NAD(P)-dependent dehydrogenase (short-subunit alcohol dehydrogenase family)
MPEPSSPDLTGRVAFITGGSSGIGLGLVRACREAGMKVAFTYRTELHRDEALSKLGGGGDELLPLFQEVEDRQGWPATVTAVQQKLGTPFLLAANAGVGSNTPASRATLAEWDACLSTNLGGVINTLTFTLPAMLAQGEGHIVLTASMSGLFPGGKSGVYTTSKFAVVGLAETLRAELAGSGLGVSAFCPGMVKTRIGLPQRVGAPSHQHGMEPLECGRLVLRGVRRNDLYILTHPEFKPGVELRNAALSAAFPEMTEPRSWWPSEENVLSCPIYQNELDKPRP